MGGRRKIWAHAARFRMQDATFRAQGARFKARNARFRARGARIRARRTRFEHKAQDLGARREIRVRRARFG